MTKLNIEDQVNAGNANPSKESPTAENAKLLKSTPDANNLEQGWLVITLLTFYLLAILGAATWAILYMSLGYLQGRFADIRIGLMCAAIGAVGGCLYCLRAVYLNYCVFGTWSNRWAPWYLIRPIVSTCCGGISFLFLKAGLLVLESGSKPDASEIGFYALALVAGLNVDKFVAKIEDVAQAVWGIDQSRARGRKGSVDTAAPTSDDGNKVAKPNQRGANSDE